MMNSIFKFNKFLAFMVIAIFSVSSFAIADEKPDSPEIVEGATSVDPAGAKELFDSEVLFVDVRKDSDWDAGRVSGAVHLDVKSALTEEALADEIEKSDKVVFYCNGVKCLRSSKAAKMAVEWGYEHVYYYRLGFPAWKEAGYPVE